MLNIGLTGSRFSGKEYISNHFHKIGVPVFNADLVLKYILNYEDSVIRDSNKLLGNRGEIFINPFSIDNDGIFSEILTIAEPYLISAWRKFKNKNANSVYSIFKSSYIFYRDYDLDGIINVHCPFDIRSSRVKLDDVYIMNIEKKLGIIQKAKGDWTINNYGDSDVLKQVLEVDKKIIEVYLNY